MNFDKNKTITYAGAALLAHSDSIKKATVIDSIIISSNVPSSSADIMKLSFDDFGNYKEFPVVNIRQNDNVFQPEAVISNEGFEKDFDLAMVGLKGHTDGEGDSQIIALAIDNSNNPFTIPKQSNVPYKLYLDLPIGYSNSNNVIMNVNNAGMVTMEDVDHAIKIAIDTIQGDINDLKTKMESKVTFDGGYISTGNGKFVPASINDVTSKIKNNVTNGDNFDNYRENGTYPMNGLTIRTIGGSGGLPSFENFSGDLTVTVKGNEIEQIISASDGQRFYRNLGQFWYQIARKEDLENTQASITSNTNSLATLNSTLQSKVSFSSGYIFTGNGKFVPAATDTVNSQLASKANVSDVNSVLASKANASDVTSALASKVTFDGGYITTGNGKFIPAATDTVNKALNAINNGLSGITPRTLGDNDDFYNLPLGIYFVNGNPKNNPYGHTCYGKAFSMDGYIQYLDQNGDAFFITPKSGGWLKYTKQADVVTLQNQMNANNSSIDNLNNKAMQYRGEWTEQGLWNVASQLDGWYYVRTNHQDGITGWNNLNSQLFKTSMPSGTMLRLYDSWGHIWYTNNFNGSFFTWKQLI